MRSLIGTWALFRLALRRDRLKLPLWIVGITATMAANVPGVIHFYGKSEQALLLYAKTTAPSIVSRLFNGPIYGPNLGEVVMNETFLFTAIAVAFMSTLAVVRHTRQNEETGRSELIGSAVVGHQASLAAALLVTLGANVILGSLISLVLLVNDLPMSGSLGAGAALAGIGIVFSLIAALTAQLSGSARGANSLAAIAIGVAFLLRGLGDGMGHLTNHGTGVISAWPSWLSPIGWAEQMYPFAVGKWWVFGLFGVLFLVLSIAAFALNAHRDLGLGMLPDRRGAVHARQSLLSPYGLAWRLQRGTFQGWAIAVVIMGGTIGLVAEEFKDLFRSNPEFTEAFGVTGNTKADVTDILFAAMMGLMAIALAGYVVQALLRLRSEESSGHLEPVLATHVSRPRWMLSHIMVAFGGVVILLLLLGISTGVTYVIVSGTPWGESIEIVKAALVYVPAVLAFAGFVIASFGLLPSKVMALSWTGFALCFLIAQFGTVLKLPRTILNVSPFAHVPAVPLEDANITPLITLLIVAFILILIGFVAFRRRDLSTA